MLKAINRPNRDVLVTMFKVFLFVLLGVVIVRALFVQHNWLYLQQYFLHHLDTRKWPYLLLALGLMPVNWLMETYKWKLLLKADSTQFSDLLKGVLAGITFGFVTPGRSGEFIGRALYATSIQRANAFYQSSIGGLAQTAVTLMVGVLLVSYWRADPFISGVMLGVCLVFLLLYFRFDWVNGMLQQLSVLRKYNLHILNDALPSLTTQLKVLTVSLCRYCIYLTQYALLFYFFGVEASWWALCAYSGMLLAVQTFSPFLPIWDMSYRGGAAVYVFSALSPNTIGILSGSLSVWLINLAIPAAIGYWLVIHKNNWR